MLLFEICCSTVLYCSRPCRLSFWLLKSLQFQDATVCLQVRQRYPRNLKPCVGRQRINLVQRKMYMVYWHRLLLAYTKWTEFSKTFCLRFFIHLLFFRCCHPARSCQKKSLSNRKSPQRLKKKLIRLGVVINLYVVLEILICAWFC